jgi:hypothetical protein
MEEINNILEKISIDSNDNNLSATLKQGLQFKKYQHKIATNKKTEKIAFDLEKSDASSISGFNELTNEEPSNIIEGFATSTQSVDAQMTQLSVLQVQYNNLIKQFNTERENLLTTTNSYIDGISSSKNPYLNKNVKTKNDGKTYYITGEGVAKLYPSTAIFNQIIGKNNCPTTTQQIDSLPAFINTKSGTQMVVGQQCGNEGKNVIVKNIIEKGESSYVGCYNDSLTSPAMTKMSNGSQIYDFTSCRQAAIDTGNLYFGLQNLNPITNKSSCYVSNDFIKSTKYQPSTTACKSDKDGNIYGATSVNAIYKTPDTTYIGLFKDSPDTTAAMTSINNGNQTFTYETCKTEAINQNKPYFGLQNFNTQTQKSACFVGDDYNKISQYGVSTASYTGNDTKIYGGTWTNAVYKIDTKKSDYIGCYNDNESSPSMKDIGKGSSNYSFDSCQKEAIKNNSIYFALQGGKQGSSKCFVSDDLRKAQKYGIYKPCIESTIDKNKYGVSENNALYKMNESSNPSYIGKIGYVDGNDKLLEYPSNMIVPGTNYSKYINYDSNSKTLKTVTNTNYNNCVIACNSSNIYYGFVFDNTSKTCYLKGSDILKPSLKTPKPNMDLYVRDVKISNANMSCNRSTVSINSNQWKNYSKGSLMTPNTTCSLTKSISDQNSKIAALQNQIGQVGGQIISILNNLKNQTDEVKNKIGMNTSKIDSDLIMYNKTINDIQNYKKSEDNMNNIVKDTNLLVLYQNYNYMFWSILAISTMIISMKMMGK